MTRKLWVTALYRCKECRLMFRIPKSDAIQNERFYQTQYRETFTSECPDDQELSHLKSTFFKCSKKDYTTYLSVLKAAGVQAGHVVLDFGASWGYGSWQLSQAGYRVYSYEVSEPRSRFAVQKLGCQMLSSAEAVPEKVDCFFAAHVIEHVTNPRTLWAIAEKVLKRSGVVILLTPNGEPSRERTHEHYHALWGQVHPLLLTAESLAIMARQFDFEGCAHSSSYDTREIAARSSGQMEGDELLYITRRMADKNLKFTSVQPDLSAPSRSRLPA